jgi:hypothetical protein
VVQAYADGKINLEKPPQKARKTNIRYAPGFILGCDNESLSHPYTAESIAEFLGWWEVKPDKNDKGGQASVRIRNALKALEILEETEQATGNKKIAQELSSLVGDMTSCRAKETLEGFSHLVNDYEEQKLPAKKAAEEALKTMHEIVHQVDKEDKKEGSGTIRPTRKKVKEKRKEIQGLSSREKYLPTVQAFCSRLSTDLYKFLGETDDRVKMLAEIIDYRNDIDQFSKDQVTGALKSAAERCQAFIDAICGHKPKLK